MEAVIVEGELRDLCGLTILVDAERHRKIRLDVDTLLATHMVMRYEDFILAVVSRRVPIWVIVRDIHLHLEPAHDKDLIAVSGRAERR